MQLITHITNKHLLNVAKFIAILLAIEVVICLLGWFTNFYGVTNPRNVGVMKMNTFICFAIIIEGLIYYCWNGSKKLVLITGLVLSIIAIATLSQYIFHINLHIDELLVEDKYYQASEMPGRMSLFSAAAFAVLGLGVVLLGFRRTLSVGQTLLIVLFAVSYFKAINGLLTERDNDDMASNLFNAVVKDNAFTYGLLSLAFLLVKPRVGFLSIFFSPLRGGNLIRRATLVAFTIPFVLIYLSNSFHALNFSAGFQTSITEFLFMLTILFIAFPVAYSFESMDKKRELIANSLQETTQKLERAQQIAKIGNWEYEIAAGTIYWSDGMYDIYEIPASTPITVEDSRKHVHPDYAADTISKFRLAIEKGISFDMETKLTNEYRGDFWARVVVSPLIVNGKTEKLIGITQDITEKKQKEDELQQAQNIAKLGSWTYDVATKKLKWAKEIYKINGISDVEEMGIDGVWQVYHPDEAPRIKALFERTISHAEAYDTEVMYQPKDGKQIWKRVIGSPVVEKGKVVRVIGVTQDITEKKVTEELIRKNQANLAAVIENTHDVIFSINRDYEVSICNQMAVGMFANLFTAPLRVGASLFAAIPDVNHEFWKGHADRALAGERYSIEYVTNTLAVPVSFEVSVNPIIGADKTVVGAAVFIRNINETKAIQKELVLQKERAEAASIAKSQFLSIMSHEIRTPLNAVIGMSNLLMDSSPREDQIERLQTLCFSSETLLSLVNDILDYNKIDSGKLQLERAAFDLKKLICNVQQVFNFNADKQKLQFEVDVDASIPQALQGDSTRLSQILINIIGNAIKFTVEGSVLVNVRVLEISDRECKLYFEIKDTGIGIPEDKIEHIFEHFTQADSATTRKFGGTGLGLPIAKRILELMGSSLNVKSKINEGTTFFFELLLPIEAVEVTEIGLDDSIRDLKKARILLVEDNVINQLVAGEFLRSWNAEVDCANDGLEGLRMVQESTYDLILMDIQMPNMSGIEATECIRQLPDSYFKKIPIIALTASVSASTKDKVMEVGMDGYATKPFRPEDLYLTIAACLARK